VSGPRTRKIVPHPQTNDESFMSDNDSNTLSGPALKQALLERLRFERSMGIESIHPVPLETRTTSAPAAAAIISQSPSPKAVSKAPAKPSGDVEARWKELESQALSCTKCVLHQGRNKVVFGCGNKQAQLVFVGEGPGADEDQQGVPFVGRAGQLLNKIINAMGIQRDEVYICNVVKCRPPDNRTPESAEILACSPFLEEQLSLISPKVIVTLGGPATKTLLQTSQGIMSIRGRWFAYKGIPVMPTYHPAFVLRQYTEENRRAVWDDMKKVMERIKQA
jgi:uracil-DNA glycosylase